MDVSVLQFDGYCFVYVLLFGFDWLFIEDIYYSDGVVIDCDEFVIWIVDYVWDVGWQVIGIMSEESGVFFVIMGGDFEGYWVLGGDMVKIGMCVGMF